MLKIIGGTEGAEEQLRLDVDELARQGALQMLAAALEWEVQEYVQRYAGQLEEAGRRQVVRNGRAWARKITLGCGTVQVAAPRINDKRLDEQGLRQRFSSRILPPYMRRSPKLAEVLPVLYLRGLSTGDFKEALPILLGQEASDLSPSAICRLTNAWSTEYGVRGVPQAGSIYQTDAHGFASDCGDCTYWFDRPDSRRLIPADCTLDANSPAALQSLPELCLVRPLVALEHGLGRLPTPQFAKHLEPGPSGPRRTSASASASLSHAGAPGPRASGPCPTRRPPARGSGMSRDPSARAAPECPRLRDSSFAPLPGRQVLRRSPASGVRTRSSHARPSAYHLSH